MAQRPDVFSELEARGGPEYQADPGSTTPSNPASQTEEMVPKSRLDEVLDRAKRAEASTDQFIVAALRGDAQGAAPQGTPATGEAPSGPDLSVLEGLDPDMADAVVKFNQQQQQEFAQRFMEQFKLTYGPALDNATRQAQVQEVETTVEGFKEVEGEVAEMFRDLPPELQREYDNRVGVENMTLKVRLRKMEEQINAMTGGSFPQVGRAAITPANRGSFGQAAADAPEVDPWSLSDDDFEKFQRDNGV